MTATDVLNPTLYRQMCRVFGEDNINIVHPGEAIDWYIVKERVGDRVVYRRKVKPQRSGEEYQVCCPFCHDTKNRLYINHNWNVIDPELGGYNLWLAQCWNDERCLDDVSNQEQLQAMLFAARGPLPRGAVRPGRKKRRHEDVIVSPGRVVRLSQLIETEPTHRALLYLAGRNFNVAELAETYQLGYVIRSDRRNWSEKIFIPVIHGGKLRGWQLRVPGDYMPDGKSLQEAGIVKALTMPGMSRSDYLYNFDVASQYRTMVLVEGPADVWGAGPWGTGILGGLLSAAQAKAIANALEPRKGTLALMLDPDVKKLDAANRIRAERGRRLLRRPVDRAIEMLTRYMPRRRIAVITTPLKDPGEACPDFNIQLIRHQGEQQKVRIYI